MDSLCNDPLTLAFHELRSPLGLVATTVRLVAEDSTDDALRRRCDTVIRTVERLLRTTERIFDLARAMEPAEAEWFSPATVVEQLIYDLDGLDVHATCRIDDAAREMKIYGPRAALEALVQTLISNAVDHGDAEATVVVARDGGHDNLVLIVRNRVARGRHYQGLGVGLYLGSRLAELFGGRLDTRLDRDEYVAVVCFPASECSSGEHVPDAADVAQHHRVAPQLFNLAANA